ncbi:MAG: hypothetical protein R3305_10355, partial [Gammaproteobacteria bacterium]|nr:hypothetical protein [Gammaproteobacteria bacterium]
MKKTIFAILVLGAAIGAGSAWVMAGRAPGPELQFLEPAAVGRIGQMVLSVETPGAELNALEVTLEQNGESFPVFSLGADGASALVANGDRLTLVEPLGRERFEALREGEATLQARAVRPVLFGYREAESRATHTFDVRLRPPIVNVQSSFH